MVAPLCAGRRIRALFEGDGAIEESYTLVHTAWPDRLDHVLGEERAVVQAVRPHVVDAPDVLTLSTISLIVKARRSSS
jgi:alpha-glucosidase